MQAVADQNCWGIILLGHLCGSDGGSWPEFAAKWTRFYACETSTTFTRVPFAKLIALWTKAHFYQCLMEPGLLQPSKTPLK